MSKCAFGLVSRGCRALREKVCKAAGVVVTAAALAVVTLGPTVLKAAPAVVEVEEIIDADGAVDSFMGKVQTPIATVVGIAIGIFVVRFILRFFRRETK